MLPIRRYWARFLLYVVLGFLSGLLVGGIVEASTAVAGWTAVGGAIGFTAGLVLFMRDPAT